MVCRTLARIWCKPARLGKKSLTGWPYHTPFVRVWHVSACVIDRVYCNQAWFDEKCFTKRTFVHLQAVSLSTVFTFLVFSIGRSSYHCLVEHLNTLACPPVLLITALRVPNVQVAVNSRGAMQGTTSCGRRHGLLCIRWPGWNTYVSLCTSNDDAIVP